MKVRGKRALLNKPGFETTAAIVAEVEDTRKWSKGRRADGKPLKSTHDHEPDVELTISDCSRTVSFDFYGGWEKTATRRNHLHKVDTMIEALTQFRDALAAEHDRYVDRLDFIEDEGDDA